MKDSEKSRTGELIPPDRSRRRHEMEVAGSGVPNPNPTGVANSYLTRWGAERQAKANDALAENLRARGRYFDAVSGATKSYLNMRVVVDELSELDDILQLDRARRAAERERGYAEIQSQTSITGHRRTQEEVEAERGAFNAAQGLENQQRLKELNAEIWERRKEAEHLDAVSIANRLREETGDARAARPKGGDAVLAGLERQAKEMERTIVEAEADGIDTAEERKLLDELNALIEQRRQANQKKSP
jgi:hypothetical protein